MKKENLAIKKFLNEDGFEELAAIGVSIELPNYEQHWWNNGEVIITDCNNKITITLDIHTLEQLENSIEKLKVLRDTIYEGYKYLLRNSEFIKEQINLKEAKNNKKDDEENI